jgi:hypothetical protein
MISITAGALLTAVAEELEVIDSGGALTAAEQASMLTRLQRYIDTTNVQRPLIFAERLDLLTLQTGVQSYTIGLDPAGTYSAVFQVPRPTKIERANLLLTSTVRRPMAVWDEKQWAAIRYQAVNGPPQGVYFDRGFGSGTSSGFAKLYFYEIPDQAYQFELYSWAQNPNVVTTADVINYPPAYAEYWLYGMVARCASMFGRQPSPVHVALLQDAKEALASANCPSPRLTGGDFNSGEGGMYNWLIGTDEL